VSPRSDDRPDADHDESGAREEHDQLRVLGVGGVEEGGELRLVAELGEEDGREDGQEEAQIHGHLALGSSAASSP
jgi:hypothetical protein